MFALGVRVRVRVLLGKLELSSDLQYLYILPFLAGCTNCNDNVRYTLLTEQ